MPEDQLKQRARWDVYLLVLRAGAMFVMAAQGLYFILVPLMALLLTYMEVWPGRVLGAVFGDPSRLWEYDPNEKTKRLKMGRENGSVRDLGAWRFAPRKARCDHAGLEAPCNAFERSSALRVAAPRVVLSKMHQTVRSLPASGRRRFARRLMKSSG